MFLILMCNLCTKHLDRDANFNYFQSPFLTIYTDDYPQK